MRYITIIFYFVATAFGAWYVIRKSNREHAVARTSDDPRLRRSMRWYDAAMVTVVCGILLMLGWMVTQSGSPSLHGVLFWLGIGTIGAGFVLAGVSGWIKGGTLTRSTDRESKHRLRGGPEA